MRTSPLALAAAAALAASGCLPSPTPIAPATATPTARASPTPEVSYDAETALLKGTSSSEWLVVGLAEAGDEPVRVPRIEIDLVGPGGRALGHRVVDLPLDRLPADAGWPFREVFEFDGTPASASARLIGDQADGFSPESVAEIVRTYIDATGTTVVLGRLTIEDTRPAAIRAIRLLGRDPAGTPVEAIDADPAQATAAPGASLPFLARLPSPTAATTWEAFPIVDGTASTGSAVVARHQEAIPDDQGNLLLTVTLDNTSGRSQWASATVLARVGTTWLAAERLDVPAPIPPGQSLVAYRFPAAVFMDAETDDAVEWTVFADGRPAEAEPISVMAEVIGYEPVGSALLIRVRLTAPEGDGVAAPTARAAIRSEGGEIASVAWGSGPDLGPGESAVVVLTIPLPRRFDLTASALDVAGIGLPASP